VGRWMMVFEGCQPWDMVLLQMFGISPARWDHLVELAYWYASIYSSHSIWFNGNLNQFRLCSARDLGGFTGGEYRMVLVNLMKKSVV
jgi:hypothetical protein